LPQTLAPFRSLFARPRARAGIVGAFYPISDYYVNMRQFLFVKIKEFSYFGNT
jgi:hypothetical protein